MKTPREGSTEVQEREWTRNESFSWMQELMGRRRKRAETRHVRWVYETRGKLDDAPILRNPMAAPPDTESLSDRKWQSANRGVRTQQEAGRGSLGWEDGTSNSLPEGGRNLRADDEMMLPLLDLHLITSKIVRAQRSDAGDRELASTAALHEARKSWCQAELVSHSVQLAARSRQLGDTREDATNTTFSAVIDVLLSSTSFLGQVDHGERSSVTAGERRFVYPAETGAWGRETCSRTQPDSRDRHVHRF